MTPRAAAGARCIREQGEWYREKGCTYTVGTRVVWEGYHHPAYTPPSHPAYTPPSHPAYTPPSHHTPYPGGLYAPPCSRPPIPERAVCASLWHISHTREGCMRLVVSSSHTREGCMRLIAHCPSYPRGLYAPHCHCSSYPRGLYAPHCSFLHTREGSMRLIVHHSPIPERALCASLCLSS